MQTRGEFDSSTSSSVQRWHPKVTPYRLFVLGTTIGVGTFKAMAAEAENASVSTTLEWVVGVVIFLILHTMNEYDESPKEPPPFLEWLFTIDCMDYFWRFTSLVGIPRPPYSSEPEPIPRLNPREKGLRGSSTPMTLYRLFVCSTTVFFGLTKATMVYYGYSDVANWIDWTLGVVITSILFILGMYENNTNGMWHAFYVPDYSTETRHGLTVVSLTAIILVWIAVCIWMIQLMWTSEHSAFLSTEDTPVPLSALTPLAVLRENLFSACFTLFMALMVVISAFAGVLGVAAVMNTPELPRWKETADWMLGQRPAWKKGYMDLESRGRRLAKKVAYHTVSLTIFLLGCAVFLAFWVVSIAANVEEGSHDPQADQWFLSFLGIAILFQLAGAGATMYLMCIVASKMLLPPLWRWRRGDADWERDLLF